LSKYDVQSLAEWALEKMEDDDGFYNLVKWLLLGVVLTIVLIEVAKRAGGLIDSSLNWVWNRGISTVGWVKEHKGYVLKQSTKDKWE